MYTLKRFESLSLHGRKMPNMPTAMNEDHLVVAHNLYAVIDGATQRKGKNIGDLTTGAYLAEYLHRSLTHIAQDSQYQDTEAALLLAGVNRAFGEKMQQEQPELIEQGFAFGPAAAIALIKMHDDGTYSYAHAGDCAIVEFGTHGDVFQCPPEAKPYHLEGARADHLRQVTKEKGITYDEAWELREVQDKYDEYKRAINVEWPIVTGDPRLENVMFVGRRSLDDVSALVLMTDGMFLPGADDLQGAEMAARQMLEHGVSAYGMSLKNIYDDDPAREKYMRFKHQDDASAMLLQFKDIYKN